MAEVSIETEDLEISVEEKETFLSPKSKGASRIFVKWDSLARYIIMALAFLLPLWILPFGGSFALGLSKSLIFFTLVLLAVIFYLINLLQEGVIIYPKSWAFLALFAVLAVGLISSFFAKPIAVSFFGTGAEVGTFFFVLFSALLFLLTVLLFQSEKKILKFFFLLVLSSLAVFVLQGLHSLFDIGFGTLLPAKLDNFIGFWSEMAIFFGFVALLVVVFLEFFEASRKIRFFLFGAMTFSLLVMALANFMAAWVVFGVLLLIFLVYLFSALGESRNFARLPLFIILVALFFILARPLMGDLITSMGLNSIEVRPSWSATYEVVKETLTSDIKSLFLGSGPNTFVYDWIKHKPLVINQTAFWNARFQSGIGLLPSFVATTGLLGTLTWLFFLFFILYYGFKSVGYSENNVTRSLLFGSFLGSVYLWIFAVIYPINNLLFVLSFATTGIFFAMLARSGIIEMKKFSFVDKTSVGFVSSLLIVLLLIGSVATFYLFFQKYWAAYSYDRGIAAANVTGDLDQAESLFLKATRFDKQDRFHRSLTDLGLVRLSQLLSQNLPQEEMRLRFQNILAFTIQHAQSATDINPTDPLNWAVLGRVYENIIPFGIDGTRNVALDSYKQAFDKGPSDPQPLLASARVEIQYGNSDAARTFLISSLQLKGDYTPALFLLARIAAQEGDLTNAIRQTEQARLTAPNDVGILFQLGLLYYQAGDYQNASVVLERAVALNINYSNARYFLGLAYDNLGQKQAAISEFEKIESLNPGNTEVKGILSNLRAGRGALSNISPPQPAPEDREEPPLEEETAGSAEEALEISEEALTESEE